MKCILLPATLLASIYLAASAPAWSGQAPGKLSDPDVPISHRDRVYAAEQFSNTVSVTDPADNRLLGVIRLGEPLPASFSPLYRGQLLVHGLGFSPDHRTLAVVAIGSNAVNFIDTATNAVTSPTSGAHRTKRSSRPTARKSGWWFGARTTSQCSTARPTRKRRGSLWQTDRA